MGQSRIAAVILCMAAVALAAEVEAAKPVYRLVAEDVGGEISECKMGPYIRCDKIEVLHENLKSEDEVEFEGLILKKTDAYEDEDMGSALYTFTNDETGTMASFIIELKSGDVDVDAKINIATRKTGGFYMIDSCGASCEVLVQLEKAPTTSEIAAGSNSGARQGLGSQECRDVLDYSLCGYLSNTGQCALMATLSTFGIWIPCPATCNTCCADSNFRFCNIVKWTWFPSCIIWTAQCRATCLLCWIPPGLPIGRK